MDFLKCVEHRVKLVMGTVSGHLQKYNFEAVTTVPN